MAIDRTILVVLFLLVVRLDRFKGSLMNVLQKKIYIIILLLLLISTHRILVERKVHIIYINQLYVIVYMCNDLTKTVVSERRQRVLKGLIIDFEFTLQCPKLLIVWLVGPEITKGNLQKIVVGKSGLQVCFSGKY